MAPERLQDKAWVSPSQQSLHDSPISHVDAAPAQLTGYQSFRNFPLFLSLCKRKDKFFCLLCCKGIITKLILMHCKRGQDVLPGISPRTQARVQPVGTRNPEGHFQGCCLDLRWAHSRQMSWVAMTWVMHNKSVSQRVYHLNQSIFNTASERVYSECSRLKGLCFFY